MINKHSFMITPLHQLCLLLKTLSLLQRIVQFTVCIGNFFTINHQLKTLYKPGFAAVFFSKRAHLNRVIDNKCGLNKMMLAFPQKIFHQ